jgi:hypothetical protein
MNQYNIGGVRMDIPKILVPKSIWKSKTFIYSLVGMGIILVMVMLNTLFGVDVPDIVPILIGVLLSIFNVSEKVKDSKVVTAEVLTTVKPKEILAMEKPIVNEDGSKYMIIIGIFVNALYGILVKEGATIPETYIISIDTIIGFFIGADKYKAGKLEVAKSIVAGKSSKKK